MSSEWQNQTLREDLYEANEKIEEMKDQVHNLRGGVSLLLEYFSAFLQLQYEAKQRDESLAVYSPREV